jgi:hypothetical protein
MSLILSGSDGLSDVDGSAATPSIRGTDANTGMFFPAADTIAFSEGGVESARLDSNGRLGIGTASPTTPLQVNGTITAPLLADTLGGSVAPSSSVMRNRIINGAMVIDQRNAGASVTPSDGNFTLDRWKVGASVASKFTVQQNAGSVTPPAGFKNYLGVTSLSAYSVPAGEAYNLYQPIEGFNTSDLDFGSASAKTVTLSFWVYSSLTGTFGGSINNSAQNRSYPFSYTISSANTWEQKSVTIAGDTTGTWIGATNGVGLYLWIGLGVGSTFSGTAGAWAGSNFRTATGATSVVGTSGATFYITGVQLEVGTQATSFEYRQYQQELALCQRYYWKFLPVNVGGKYGAGFCNGTSVATVLISFPVQMRVAPTALEQSGTATDYSVFNALGATVCSSVPTFSNSSSNTGDVSLTTASVLTLGQGAIGRANTTNGYLAWSAEL